MTQHEPKGFAQAIKPGLCIPATRLLAICRHLHPAYQRRTTIPVLGTVLVVAGKTGTSFRVTDLDVDITISADDLVAAAPFSACVPFSLLHRIAASFDGLVAMSFIEGAAHRSGKMDQLSLSTDDGCSATINLLCPAADFPPATEVDNDEWQMIDTSPADLRRMLDLARHCVSKEETRYYLNGVNLQCKPGSTTLRSIATDGHRMAIIDGEIEAPEGLNIILPTVCVNAIRALIHSNANDPVIIRILATRRIRLTCAGVRIDCKLIDGTFPDYTRVIPQKPTRAVATLTAAALRRLMPFATHRLNGVKITAGRASIISAYLEGEISTPVSMSVTDETDAVTLQSEWGFNLAFLAAQARITATFRMEFAAPGDPARVFGEDPDAMWLIMPMRV